MSHEIAGPAPADGQLGTRAQQQVVMAILGQRAFSGIDASALMAEAVASVVRILKVRHCNVLELIPGTRTFRLCAGVGWTGKPHQHATVDGGPTSQAGYTLASGMPVVVEDYQKETRFKLPPVVHDQRVTSGMSVVIPGRDGPFGVLAVATPSARAFREEDVTFLQGVANVLAAAVERRRNEDSLLEANHRLQALIYASPLAIIGLDGDGSVRSWNATAERLFGWSEDEVVGQPDPILFQSPREEVVEVLRRVLQGETFTEIATQVARKDGAPVDVTVSAAPVHDRSGSISGLTVLIADTTGHRLTEAAQAQLIEIIESTTDFVTITEVPGQGFYINKAGRRVLGIDADKDISKLSLADIYSEDTWSFIANEVIPAAVRDGGWSGEVTLFSRNGQEIPVSMVMVAHKGPNGNVDFYSIIARDISERKRFEEQMVHLASHDPLTDLYNRRRFEEEVERHLAEARRYNINGALLFVDLDQFKEINDSMGHLAGDALLVRVAALLREGLRETDIIARIGGDEFAILLPHTDEARAVAVAERLIEGLRNTTVEAEGRVVGVTASIGIVLFPEDATTAGELLARADSAMYRAKGNGRNQFGLYTPGQDGQADGQAPFSWQRRIREALEGDLFVLRAQPILDLRTGRVAHYELLIRLVGEKGELIPPGAFLEPAERFGLIEAIDRWVVQRAIRLLAAQHAVGREFSLVVNLSGKALADGELPSLIQQALSATSVNPRYLALEFTQTAAITNIYQAEKFVNALRRMGCRVGLDDFGVGLASFYHLKHLPVDYLKIDGSFIRDLPRDSVNQQLVKAMVAVARALGKETIAEFVSDAESVQLLREYGVDYAQGYHIGADAGMELVSSGMEAPRGAS